jgi:hypothetical protein
MAKIKGRIGNRGKIRPLVRKRPEKRGPHWSITKRAAVWNRRRFIDEVWLTETISITDEILVSYSRYFDEAVTMADAVALGNDKLLLSSTVVETDAIAKHAQPSSTDSMTVSDSVGMDLQSLNTKFNNFNFNFALFNGVGYDQEFLTDSVTMSDSVSLNASTAQSESVSVSDSVGFSFVVSSVFNANLINLSQFNE